VLHDAGKRSQHANLAVNVDRGGLCRILGTVSCLDNQSSAGRYRRQDMLDLGYLDAGHQGLGTLEKSSRVSEIRVFPPSRLLIRNTLEDIGFGIVALAEEHARGRHK
jgi:hypothetical protein